MLQKQKESSDKFIVGRVKGSVLRKVAFNQSGPKEQWLWQRENESGGRGGAVLGGRNRMRKGMERKTTWCVPEKAVLQES